MFTRMGPFVFAYHFESFFGDGSHCLGVLLKFQIENGTDMQTTD